MITEGVGEKIKKKEKREKDKTTFKRLKNASRILRVKNSKIYRWEGGIIQMNKIYPWYNRQ